MNGEFSGWEELNLSGSDAAPDERERMADAQLALASHFNECFSSDAGKLVLNYLKKAELNRPVATGQASETLVAIGIRQGRTDLVQEMLTRIRLAREGVSVAEQRMAK